MGEPWQAWRARRPAAEVVHLDSGAAGRSSYAVLDAVGRHLAREAATGGYEAASAAAGALADLRHGLADLLGLTPDDVALTESATASLRLLLGAWPLREGARVGVAPATWGPNVELLHHHGLAPVLLEVDDDGVLDLAALERRLRSHPPDVLLLDQVSSHRGLVQPVSEVVRLARAAGTPVWVDVAQALGHVDCATDADALVATSRKWLTGPRGIGVLAVASRHHDRLRVVATPGEPDLVPLRVLESGEAFVAGRVGLGVAVAELHDAGATQVHARLAEVGAQVREAVADVAGWSVVRPRAPAGSITALAPTTGQDVGEVRTRLLSDHGVLTTASLPWRAPTDPWAVPALRVSGHVDTTDDDLEQLLRGLRATTGRAGR